MTSRKKKYWRLNMKKVCLVLLIAFSIALFPVVAGAQFKPESGEIKGYMVNEYYDNWQHHDEDIKGRHGFWFRRIYFTYNNKLSDNIKMRFRLEMNSTSDLFSAATLVPFVKDAYIDFKLGASNLTVGIMGPPSYTQLEDIWGWRPLEKTPLDLYKWQSSRDMGVSLKGGKNVVYHVMFANGSSNKSEINNGKKLYGALGYKNGGFFVEAMAQYERAKDKDDDIILQGFGAYSADWGRVGLQYAYREYKQEDKDSLPYNILSAFAIYKFSKTVELIGRYDMNFGEGYETKFSGSGIDYVPFANNHEFSFIIAALSWQVHKNVWLMPNIKFATYKENDLMKDSDEYKKPGNDLYGFMTLYFKF